MTETACAFCTPTASEAAILQEHGIKRVSAPAYMIGGFRYARLDDAVAQARRLAYLAN